MKYKGFDLTADIIRPDGYYWVVLKGIDPIVGKYVYLRHAGSGLWYGFWRLPGHSIEYADSDFVFIDAERLPPPEIVG